jgi:transposase
MPKAPEGPRRRCPRLHPPRRGAALPRQLRSVIAPLLAVSRQLTYCDEVIKHLAAHDPRVARLRTVPSIGPITTAAFLATIDEAQRFHQAHEVEA